jgi:hypothetical protein
MKIGCRLLILFVVTFTLNGSPAPVAIPQITDLFSADERVKSGISKLSSSELAALNGAIFRILMEMNLRSKSTGVSSTGSSGNSLNLDFYDSRGRAAAYVDGDESLTIYLWDGKPVAYLDEDNIYGFNGKHLGWLKGNAIYDHEGYIVAALPEAFSTPVSDPPAKGFKQFLPFKEFKEFKPFKPFFNSTWSETPAKIFFLKGAAN